LAIILIYVLSVCRGRNIHILRPPLQLLNHIQTSMQNELVHAPLLLREATYAIAAALGSTELVLEEWVVAVADNGEVEGHISRTVLLNCKENYELDRSIMILCCRKMWGARCGASSRPRKTPSLRTSTSPPPNSQSQSYPLQHHAHNVRPLPRDILITRRPPLVPSPVHSHPTSPIPN
jgi:hypothetical protein